MIESKTQESGGGSRKGRILALAVIIFVVCAQIAGIALGAGGSLWPFLRYPMYATAGQSDFRHRELCVVDTETTHTVTAWDLGITTFRFIGLLARAGRESPDGDRARSRIAGLVGRVYGPGAGIELWHAEYHMGPDGLDDAAPPWNRVRAWEAETVGDVASLPPLPKLRPPTRRAQSGQCGQDIR